MEVLVLKAIDSASLKRIVQPGEIVDLPIEDDDVLFKNRIVVHPTDDLSDEEIALVEKTMKEGPPRLEARPTSTLLTDNDLRREGDDDGSN